MSKRIAINGFGRIGRLTLRNLLGQPNIEVIAINDLTDNETLAHLFKYDSAHGIFGGTVTANETSIIVNGQAIASFAERDPAKLPWADLQVDVVLECTGRFTSREEAGAHLTAGAKKVVISAPAKGKDVATIVLGVNDHEIVNGHDIVSNASCTTNCFAPMVKILDETVGVVRGSMTTVHAYTADQNLHDAPHRDLRRARAAAESIVPTTTGAAKAVSLVYPKIQNRFTALALRVPTITGSVTVFSFLMERPGTVEQINAAFQAAAEGPMRGYVQYCTDEIVSRDIVGNKHSCIFDAKLTEVNGEIATVSAWYDNEAGYSARLAELATKNLTPAGLATQAVPLPFNMAAAPLA